jgi:hypothetical protein
MKNKKSLYILIPAVLLVWGLILYKIYAHFDTGYEIHNISKGLTNSGNNYLAKSEDYRLIVNYPDPFLGGITNTDIVRSPLNVISKKSIVWPEIKIGGFIENKKNKKIKIWVMINSTSFLMETGDANNNVKLTRILSDSVQFEFSGFRKYFMISK